MVFRGRAKYGKVYMRNARLVESNMIAHWWVGAVVESFRLTHALGVDWAKEARQGKVRQGKARQGGCLISTDYETS